MSNTFPSNGKEKHDWRFAKYWMIFPICAGMGVSSIILFMIDGDEKILWMSSFQWGMVGYGVTKFFGAWHLVKIKLLHLWD